VGSRLPTVATVAVMVAAAAPRSLLHRQLTVAVMA